MIRIWHHSFTVLQNLPPYREAMAAHLAKASAPGTEVVMHGMHEQTYQTEYPGNDIQFAYFQNLHSQQFVLGEDIEDAMSRAHGFQKKGYRLSYDILGEGARTAADARRISSAVSGSSGWPGAACVTVSAMASGMAFL